MAVSLKRALMESSRIGLTLRVADVSAKPIISCDNTNAPAIMIGEKCAGFILEEAA